MWILKWPCGSIHHVKHGLFFKGIYNKKLVWTRHANLGDMKGNLVDLTSPALTLLSQIYLKLSHTTLKSSCPPFPQLEFDKVDLD
jgi:hypothetical protein